MKNLIFILLGIFVFSNLVYGSDASDQQLIDDFYAASKERMGGRDFAADMEEQTIPKCTIPKAGADESIWNVTGFFVIIVMVIFILIMIFAPGPISSLFFILYGIFAALFILPALSLFPYDDAKDCDYIAMKNLEWNEQEDIILSFDYDYKNIK